MKTVRITFLLLFISQLSYRCKNESNVKDILSKNNDVFVAGKYRDKMPIAAIINMPNNTVTEKKFEISKTEDLKIYGVGELIYNFAGVSPKYYFKGDDIEMFFKYLQSGQPKEIVRQFIISFSETKGIGAGKQRLSLPNGVDLQGMVKKISTGTVYYVSIKFPWKTLGVTNPNNISKLDLEAAIGDCDDHFIQKGKVSWATHKKDPLYTDERLYGELVINGSAFNGKYLPRLLSLPRSKTVNDTIPATWNTLPGEIIANTVMGEVRNRYDLLARMRSCWDKDSLYFFFEIQDQKLVKIKTKELREERTFADYGWIEDEKGKKIWEMNALNGVHAGGAFKNQKVEGNIRLKPGRYVLKYTTDESHSYNDWDSEPPLTPFYGIVIYER